MPKLFKLNQKGVIHLIPLFLILAGIIVGVYLVQHPQIFKPKAASESFEFINGECVKDEGGEKVLTCAGPVKFKLISPLETGQTTDVGFQIVKKAYAQTTGGKDYFCDSTKQDESLIFRRQCNAVFSIEILCDWKLFGAKWEDIPGHCDVGLKCESSSQGIFEGGARCVVDKEDIRVSPVTPVQFGTPTPRPANFIPPQPTSRPSIPARITPVPTLRSAVQLTATPRPTATAVPTQTPTPVVARGPGSPEPTPTPTPVSKNATLSLFPASWSANKGCSFSVQIRLNTASAQTAGADATLFFDPAKLEATKIIPGTIYPDYPSQFIDPSGKVLVSGLARPSTPYTGLGILATVNFKVLEQALLGPTKISFDFDPNDKSKAIDSNVVEEGTNADVLTAVSNGEYNIGSGKCPAGDDSAGTGQTNPPDAVRTTTHYRFSETPDKFEDKEWGWLPYTAGGVTVEHTFKESGSAKFIYAQFKDNQGNIVNAKPYPRQINLETAISPTVEPTVQPTTAVKPTPTPTPRAATPTVRPTSTPVPSAACDLQGKIENWSNCPTKESLKATLLTLPQETRDDFPNEAVTLYTNDVMKQLFSLKRLSELPGTVLKSFSNGDLLAIADASGLDRRTFFLNFDCSRIGLFTQDIRDLFKNECGF